MEQCHDIGEELLQVFGVGVGAAIRGICHVAY